jgi:hypothetical protein
MDDPKLKRLFKILTNLMNNHPLPSDGEIFVDPIFSDLCEKQLAKFGKKNYM